MVGVHEGALEVMFDHDFIGGGDLQGRCHGRCGIMLPPSHLLNLAKPQFVNLQGDSPNSVLYVVYHQIITCGSFLTDAYKTAIDSFQGDLLCFLIVHMFAAEHQILPRWFEPTVCPGYGAEKSVLLQTCLSEQTVLMPHWLLQQEAFTGFNLHLIACCGCRTSASDVQQRAVGS